MGRVVGKGCSGIEMSKARDHKYTGQRLGKIEGQWKEGV